VLFTWKSTISEKYLGISYWGIHIENTSIRVGGFWP